MQGDVEGGMARGTREDWRARKCGFREECSQLYLKLKSFSLALSLPLPLPLSLPLSPSVSLCLCLPLSVCVPVQVFCHHCTNFEGVLHYKENKMERVCQTCYETLKQQGDPSLLPPASLCHWVQPQPGVAWHSHCSGALGRCSVSLCVSLASQDPASLFVQVST